MEIGQNIYWNNGTNKRPQIEFDEIIKITSKVAITKKGYKIQLITYRNMTKPFWPSVFMSEIDCLYICQRNHLASSICKNISKVKSMPLEKVKQIHNILNYKQ